MAANSKQHPINQTDRVDRDKHTTHVFFTGSLVDFHPLLRYDSVDFTTAVVGVDVAVYLETLSIKNRIERTSIRSSVNDGKKNECKGYFMLWMTPLKTNKLCVLLWFVCFYHFLCFVVDAEISSYTVFIQILQCHRVISNNNSSIARRPKGITSVTCIALLKICRQHTYIKQFHTLHSFSFRFLLALQKKQHALKLDNFASLFSFFRTSHILCYDMIQLVKSNECPGPDVCTLYESVEFLLYFIVEHQFTHITYTSRQESRYFRV